MRASKKVLQTPTNQESDDGGSILPRFRQPADQNEGEGNE
jgi:hypothetical protein